LQTSGKVDEAIDLVRETHRRYLTQLGPVHRESLVCSVILVMTELCRPNAECMIPFAEETVRRCTNALGPDDFDTQRARNALGLAYWQAGRGFEAIPWLESAIRGYEATKQGISPDAFKARNNLGLAYLAVQRAEEAVRVFRETVEWSITALGPEHHNTLFYQANLALSHARCGQHDEAIRIAEDNLPKMEASLGAEHSATVIGKRNLEKWRGVKVSIAEAVAEWNARTEGKPKESPEVLQARLDWANALAKANRFGPSTTEAKAVYEARRKNLGADNAETLEAWNVLSKSLQKWGLIDKSSAEFRNLFNEIQDQLPEKSPLLHRIATDYLTFLTLRRHPEPKHFLVCLKIIAPTALERLREMMRAVSSR